MPDPGPVLGRRLLVVDDVFTEGSTLREGKYKTNVRRAVDYLMAKSMPNGLLGNPSSPADGSQYMYGHGFAMLFLSSVVGEEEEGEGPDVLRVRLTGEMVQRKGVRTFTLFVRGQF